MPLELVHHLSAESVRLYAKDEMLLEAVISPYQYISSFSSNCMCFLLSFPPPKIWVWPERLQTMHLLGYLDVFTTRTSLTRVRAVPRYSFSLNTLEGLNEQRPTIGIMPSGIPWLVEPFEGKRSNSFSLSVASTDGSKQASQGTRVDRNMRSIEKVHSFIFSVPYSDHSCFQEIKDFVQLIKPYNVKGIVSMSPWYVDPRYYLSHLFSSNNAPPITCLTPETREEGENVDLKGKMKSKDVTVKARKKRTEVNFLGVRIRRVSALRRISRGVKIVECDSMEASSLLKS